MLSTRCGKKVDDDEWKDWWKGDIKIIKRYGITFDDEEDTWVEWKTEPLDEEDLDNRSIS